MLSVNVVFAYYYLKRTRYESLKLDPHGQNLKEYTRLKKSPSFVLIRLLLTEIQPFNNVIINKEMYGNRTLCSDSVRMAVQFFVKFDIFKWLYLAYYWVYLQQTWGFCKAWSALYDYMHFPVTQVLGRSLRSKGWTILL